MRHHTTLALILLFAAVPALAEVTGTVMNMDGQPVAGARVTLHPFESQEARRTRLVSEDPERPALAAAETDSKGNFSLESPKDAVVILGVQAAGYVPTGRAVERDEAVGVIPVSTTTMKQGMLRADGKPVADTTVAIQYGMVDYVTRSDENGRYLAPESRVIGAIDVIHPDLAAEQPARSQAMSQSMPSLNVTLRPRVAVSGLITEGDTAVAGATIFADGWPVATSGDDGKFSAKVPSHWKTLSAKKDLTFGAHIRAKDTSPTIRLTPLTVVSGRVTVAGSNSGIAGVAVSLSPARPGAVVGSESVQTDAKGTFSLAVPAGSHLLRAVHPAYQPQTEPLATAPGQKSSRDVSLVQYARVTGSVMDENRRPVAAAVIDAQDVGGDPMVMIGRMRRLGGAPGTTVVSGPDGRFTIRLDPEGEMSVWATKKGFPSAKSEPLRLSPGERKGGIALTIPTGIEVTGKVTDSEGAPISGVAIAAIEVHGGQRGMVMRTMIVIGRPGGEGDETVRTSSDGTFSIRLKEGTYDLAFQRDGYASKAVRGQTVSASEPLVIEATLDPAVEISGRVVRNGAGIEDVNVTSFAIGAGQSTNTVVTGPDGSFTITGLAPGSVFLNVRKDEDFISERRNATAPARDLVIEIPPGGIVTGRVIDKSSRKPVTSFQAGISTSASGSGMIRMAPPQLRDFNSDNGSFTLENVPSGATVLIASAPGFTSSRMNVTIEEGKTLSGIEIELDTGVRLTGRVTGPNGGGVSDVQVFVLPSTGGMVGAEGRTTTDSNGEYSIEALQPGEETVSFSHTKYVSTRKTVTLKGQETRLDAQLSAGLRVTGVVVTDSGAPVADASVEAFASNSRRQARTNASGTFEMENLAEGRHRFVASKAGFSSGTVNDVDISSGAPVRIALGAGGTLYGRVSGLPAEELSMVAVDARNAQGSASGTVDSNGNYRIEGAPTGTVQVSAGVLSRTMNRKSSAVQTVELAPGGSQQVDIAFRGDVVIRGRVLRNGAPLRGGNITFIARGGTHSTSGTDIDEQGQYSASGLEEGEYNVQVFDTQRFNAHSTSYTVRGSATFDIEYRTSSLRGRVVDAATSEPLDNVNLQLRPVSTSPDMGRLMVRSALTDANGTFVIDEISPGSYSATASRDGYGNEVTDVRVTERSSESLDMKLSRNDGVILKIVDARDGRAVTGHAIVFDGQGRVVFDSRTNFMFSPSDGDRRLPLAAGSYTATVYASGFAHRTVSFHSPSTQSVPLSPGGTLLVSSKHAQPRRIRLIDSTGFAYPRTSPAPSSRQLLPSPGTTTLQNVAPGTYTIQLLGDNDAVLDSRQVVVGEGQTVSAEI